jgi:hypothetical protein
MARVLERIHKISSGKCGIRVWCASSDLRNDDEGENQRAAIWTKLKTLSAVSGLSDLGNLKPHEVATALATLHFCNAVEVVMGDTGVLIYPEWP